MSHAHRACMSHAHYTCMQIGLGEVLQAYVPTEIPLPRTTETDEPSRLIEVRAAYIDVQGCFGS